MALLHAAPRPECQWIGGGSGTESPSLKEVLVMAKSIADLPDYPSALRLAEALWREEEVGRGAAVMVGAGFSRCAERPSPDTPEPPLWWDLQRKMKTALYRDDPDDAPNDPLRLAQEYKALFGAADLYSFIRTEVPDKSWLPGEAHRRLLTLPWVEVLTTNWDTLLERAARNVGERNYQVVRNKSDLAQARSPRIIKLHGTIDLDESYVFAEDDYRIYPIEHAGFVNLARQILLENDLCMVGFSGSDPNFLQWSGWVRDQLGDASRRIYLVGVLGLSRSASKVLTDRNIVPIDLRPMVSHLPRSRQHGEALEKWVEFLEDAKPAGAHVWTLHREAPRSGTAAELDAHLLDPPTIAKDIRDEILPSWEAEREAYPGWLVCPRELRDQVKGKMYSTIGRIERARSALKPEEWRRLVYETSWRHEVAWLEPPDDLVGWMQEILAVKDAPDLDEDRRQHFLCVLLRHAREARDQQAFERWRGMLEAECDKNSDRYAECVYQTCLLKRDECKFDELDAAVGDLRGQDPAYSLRKAALYSDLGRYAEGHRVTLDALESLRTRELDNRRSIWIRSRRAWAQWLVFMSPHERAKGVSGFDRDFHAEQASQCNPWSELKSVGDAVRGAKHDRYERAVRRVEAAFEAGRFRDRSKEPEVANPAVAAATAYSARRLLEVVGIPSNVDARHPYSVDLDGHCLVPRTDATWITQLVAKATASREERLDEFLGRVPVAKLPSEEARLAVNRLLHLADCWLIRISQEQVDRHRQVRRALEGTLTGIVRLTPRMSTEEAERAFRLGLRIMKSEWLPRSSKTHSVLHKLFEHSLAAIAAESRVNVALEALQAPLSSETTEPSQGDRDTWPNPMAVFSGESGPVPREGNAEAWSVRIAEVIRATRAGESRSEAAIRLLRLHEMQALGTMEAEAYGEALWNETSSGVNALPVRTNLYPSAFATLPAPRDIDVPARVRARVYEVDEPAEYERAIAMVVAAHASKPILPDAMTAARLFDQIAAALAAMKEADDPFGGFWKPSLVARRRVAAEALASAIVPMLAARDRSDNRLHTVLDLAELEGCAVILQCLPHFLSEVGRSFDRVLQRIEDALTSSNWEEVRAACKAVDSWYLRDDLTVALRAPEALAQALLYALEGCRLIDAAFLLPCAAHLLDAPNALPAGAEVRIGRSVLRICKRSAYEDVAMFSIDSAIVSHARAECCAIARKLTTRLDGRMREDLDRWLSVARSDPLPEVRDAARKAL